MDLHCLVPLFNSVCGLWSKYTKAKQNKSVISYRRTKLDIEKLLRYCKPLFVPIAAPDLKTHCLCKATVVGQDPREVMAMCVGWLCSAILCGVWPEDVAAASTPTQENSEHPDLVQLKSG